jgi:CHRD domain
MSTTGQGVQPILARIANAIAGQHVFKEPGKDGSGKYQVNQLTEGKGEMQMKKVKLLLFVILSTILTVSVGFAAEKSFHAKLTGNDEVPSVKTKASGDVKFKLSSDGKTLSYTLHVKNILNATVAHIHRGMKGKSGPPLVNLFTGPNKEGKFSGDLAMGTITANELSGDLMGKSLDDLVQIIKADDAYVNVHTDANPNGEIRGQIK